MKYLAVTSACLFLLAAPVPGFAQSTNNNTSDTATGAGAGSTDQNTGGSGENTGNPNSGSQASTGSDSQCNDQTATSGYGSFSEKCRNQIDTWAMSQSGKSAAFEGDIAVGTMVPETVEIIDVPVYHNYGYVMLNDRRVLVDRSTRKVIRVY